MYNALTEPVAAVVYSRKRDVAVCRLRQGVPRPFLDGGRLKENLPSLFGEGEVLFLC